MTHFWDKPKEIEYEISNQQGAEIPKPPKGLLYDKEYIVFQTDIGKRVGNTFSYFIFISSFGRYLHYSFGPGASEWLDVSSPNVLKRLGWWEFMDLPPLFFINQGWINLLKFLDSPNQGDGMVNRLILPFVGSGADGYGGTRFWSCLKFIPRLLSLYVEFFPDSVITETNNDPDVFFRNKQINPTLLKIFDELRGQLQPSDEVIPEWRTHARFLTSQPAPEGEIKYDDFIQARKSLRKIVKGGGKKKTKKKRSRRKTIKKKKSRKKKTKKKNMGIL